MGRRMGRRAGRRSNRYSGLKLYKETKAGEAIIMPGGGQNYRAKLTANFLDITNTSPPGAVVSTIESYRSLYERYAIVGVKFRFIPTNTSSDSTTRSADRVTHAINRGTSSRVGAEIDILRQDDCKFTNTNREITIYVKNPKPCFLEQIVPANERQSDYTTPVGGAGVNANLQAPSRKGWTWLSTRMGISGDASGNLIGAHPDHVGADFHIQCLNPTVAEPYQVYTLFKTVYFAFKEQD